MGFFVFHSYVCLTSLSTLIRADRLRWWQTSYYRNYMQYQGCRNEQKSIVCARACFTVSRQPSLEISTIRGLRCLLFSMNSYYFYLISFNNCYKVVARRLVEAAILFERNTRFCVHQNLWSIYIDPLFEFQLVLYHNHFARQTSTIIRYCKYVRLDASIH